MKTVINSYNHTQNNFFIQKELNEKDIQNDKTTEVTISSQTKEKIENIDSIPKTIVNIDTKMIIVLQEFQDSTTSSIPAQKTNEIKDEINFNGTPCWSWLIDRDNKLYNKHILPRAMGVIMINSFNEIVERTKNDTVISKEDYTTIQRGILGFDLGGLLLGFDRDSSVDPIVHKVFDYKILQGQKIIDQFKQFLATKTKEPEIDTFKFKTPDIKTDTNSQQLVSSISETIKLLDFLEKDLRWYEWYLKNEKENHTSIYSLKYFAFQSSTTYIFNI